MIVLAVASLAVLAGSVAAAAILTPRGTLAYLLAVALIAWGVVNTLVSFAGLVLRDLSAFTLTGLAFVWLAAAVILAARTGAARTGRYRAAAGVRATLEALRWAPSAIAAALVTLMLCWRSFLALRLPVVDVLGWQYHLVSVDVWLQSNALVRVTQNIWTDGWPAAAELLTTWLAAFTRTDGFTGFTALLPIPMAMVATSGLARSLGAGRRSSLLAGLLFGMMPAVVALAGTTYPDTGAMACVIGAWWLGLRMLRGERDASSAILFGIAVGLALGAKGTSIPLVAPMAAAVMIALVRDLVVGLRTSGASRALVQLGLMVVPVLVLGGSWYLKNLLVHGNPLYPVAFGPFPGPAPAGTYGAPPVPASLAGLPAIEQTLRSWLADWRLVRYTYNQRPGGFGLAWMPLLAFAVGGLVTLARRWRLDALCLVIAPALVTLAAMTSPWYARYTLYIPGVALPLAAVALDAMRPRPRTAAAIGLVCLASVSLAVTNIRPNVSLPVAGPINYARFVLTEPDATRANVNFRATCSGFDAIPPGARVAVSHAFFIPHAVVGPNLDRILTDPMADLTDGPAVTEAMRARKAGWLVTQSDTNLDRVAASDPAHFVGHGEVCSDGNLWEFRPDG